MNAQRIGGYTLVAVVAAALGATATRMLDGPGAGAEPGAAIDVVDIADVSSAQAEALRASRYESLATIEDVLALPGEFAELEALYAVAARADSAEIQNLLYQAVRVGDPARRDAFVRALLTRLVEIDPRTALAFADGPLGRSGRDYTAFAWRQWARRDFDSALNEASMSAEQPAVLAKAFYEALPGLDDPRASEVQAVLGVAPTPETRARVIERAYADGPGAALALLEAQSQWSNADLSKFAELLYAELGPESIEWIEEIASPSLREALNGMLLQRFAGDAPLEFLERFDEVAGTTDPTSTLSRAFAALAASDPDAALAALDRVRPAQRPQLEMMILSAVARTDPATAISLLDGLRYASRDAALQRIAISSISTDFELALSAASMASSPSQRRILLGSLANSAPLSQMRELAERVFSIEGVGEAGRFPQRNLINSWARRDAEAALAWVQSRPESDQVELLGGVLGQIANEDPQRAIDLAMSIEGGQAFAARRQLVDYLMRQQQFDTALSFANMLPDADARSALQMRALTHLARREPERALDLAQTLGNTEIADQVLSTTLITLASQDPQAALARAGEIADPDVRAATESSVMTQFANRDPSAAREMIATLPAGPARDGALSGIARQTDIEVDEAIRLANQIEDPALRQQTQGRVILMLARRDPGAARDLADSIDFPDAYRQRLDQTLRRQGSRVFR